MNKQLIKRIVIFSLVCVSTVLVLKQAVNNYRIKEQYEQQTQEYNRQQYNKYFNKGVDNE